MASRVQTIVLMLLFLYCQQMSAQEDCDWKLVFKVQAKAGADSYPLWSSGFTPSNLPGDLRLAPIGHYKSRDVGIWESLNIKKVKLSLYTFSPNMEIRDLVFNGMGSNKDNWFSKSRLISSPWTDLKTAPTNYFSIPGHSVRYSSSSRVNRRFYINRSYAGCPGDRGWLVVLDGHSNVCLWERRNSGNPRILFSKLPINVNFERDRANVGIADVMAIFIKTCDD
ncbi:Hypp3378 [Branchiostoma lanceolatum]|uniref:Hypp3378 protein n=1 Tax=Branchiostoma lanceolatum TaxID=7740 RepID=A0A8K0A0T5_BRALA|nr:Hypp3378 [Branchiostoma lanceolatum]